MAKAAQNTRQAIKQNLIRPEHPSWGMEPVYDRLITDHELSVALTWYSSNLDLKKGRQYLADWLIQRNFPKVAKIVLSAGEDCFTPTLYKLARIMNNGATISDIWFDRYKLYLQNGMKKYDNLQTEKIKAKQAAIYKSTRLNEKNVDILSKFEDAVDAHDNDFDPADVTQDDVILAKITEYYKRELASAQKVQVSEDLTEGAKLEHITYLEHLIWQLEGDAPLNPPTVRKPRKPRAKKVIPAAKKVEKVQIRVEYIPYSIKSIPPDQIIGKQVLWFYDVKYGKLTKLVAASDAGLDVKGTTVINYDEKLSICKRAGRKGQAIVKTVLEGGKILRRKLFDEINTDPTAVTGRLSNNIVLLMTEK